MRKSLVLVAVVLASIVASCFSITVNVYFPEKDVKSAYQSLEQQLLKGTGEMNVPAPALTPPAPKGAKPGTKPESRLEIRVGPATACAAESAGDLSVKIADKLKSDPDVVAAYRNMGERLGFIDGLRDKGTLGEGNDGLLKPRGELTKKEKLAMDEDNKDRKAIIKAMGKAIVELNGQPVTDAALKDVVPKAAAEFAGVRGDAAKPGWWVQGADGNWTKK